MIRLVVSKTAFQKKYCKKGTKNQFKKLARNFYSELLMDLKVVTLLGIVQIYDVIMRDHQFISRHTNSRRICPSSAAPVFTPFNLRSASFRNEIFSTIRDGLY
jgi:hypothetical protein